MFISRVFVALAASAAVAVSADTKPLEYFVYAPAQSDFGMPDRQKAAAAAHLEHANALNATGHLGKIETPLTPAGTIHNLVHSLWRPCYHFRYACKKYKVRRFCVCPEGGQHRGSQQSGHGRCVLYRQRGKFLASSCCTDPY